MGRSGVGIAGSDGTTLAEVTTAAPASNAPGMVVRVLGGSGGGAVTIADGADVALGTTTDIAWVSGAGTVIALLKKVIAELAATLTVDASGHTVPVSGTFFPALQAVAASEETSTIYNGSTALTPAFAAITASNSGATTIVNAIANKQIRVLNYVVVANAAVNVKFQSHVAGDITGLEYFAANGGVSSPVSPTGLFQTTAGEALDINLSSAVAVGGHLSYVAV